MYVKVSEAKVMAESLGIVNKCTLVALIRVDKNYGKFGGTCCDDDSDHILSDILNILCKIVIQL